MKKILLFGLMFLVLISSVYATTYGESYYNIGSSNNGTCQYIGDSGCNVINRYVSWNRYNPDDTILYNIAFDETSDDGYNFEMEYRIYSIAGQSPYNETIKEFGTLCYTNYNDTKTIIMNETFTPQNFTTGDSWKQYRVNLPLSAQFYCKSYTQYYNHSVTRHFIADRVILHYASIPYTYPVNYLIQMENKDAEIDNLNSRLIEGKQTTFDKISDNITALISMNMNVIVILYWVFMILLGFFSIGLIFYIVFWIYNFFKSLFG